MTLHEIRQLPTCYTDAERGKCHESILRYYHISEKLMSLVDVGAPKEVIREIFDDLTAGTAQHPESFAMGEADAAEFLKQTQSTRGTEMAAKTRAKANKLTDEQRNIALLIAVSILGALNQPTK